MKLALPSGPFAAYLFDCDGTIVDSMPIHYIAWKRALAEHGCPFPEDQFYGYGGQPVDVIVRQLNAEHGLAMPVEQVTERKESYYYAALDQLQAIPEVVEHIDDQYGKLPFAVVSGSTRESVTRSLAITGLLDKFPVMVCAGEYEHGKPDPECFLKAAALLGVAPARCLVFEDTVMGIAAAEAAGMAWVRVPAPWER